MNQRINDDRYGWRKEGRDLMRAIAGGSIVGMPLLYTLEMWHHGMSVSAWHLLMLLGVTLILNFAFCFLSGFRMERTIGYAAMEAITAVGIAIVYSAAILWLIGELKHTLALSESIGKILLEAAAVSIGVSFASAQIGNRSRTGEGTSVDEGAAMTQSRSHPDLAPGELQARADLREFAAALAGSTVFALNVAPTEEIKLIAGRLSPLQLLVMLGASLLLCYIILFAAEFRSYIVHVKSPLQHPLAETILTCAISHSVAAGLLFLLGEREAFANPSTAVASIVTLGLPATVGGAAGRLIA